MFGGRGGKEDEEYGEKGGGHKGGIMWGVEGVRRERGDEEGGEEGDRKVWVRTRRGKERIGD